MVYSIKANVGLGFLPKEVSIHPPQNPPGFWNILDHLKDCVCVCTHTHSPLYFFHSSASALPQVLHRNRYRVFQDLDQILTSRNQINFRQCLGSARGQSTQKHKPIPVRARWILSRQTYWPHIGSAQMHTLEHAPHTHTHTGACTHIHTHTHFGPGCHKT